jgi:hypothetical protein
MKWIVCLFVLFLVSCNEAKESAANMGASEMAVADAATVSLNSPIPNKAAGNSTALTTYERKIIKNAFLSFESDKPAENVRTISQLVSKNQGYIISNNQSKIDNVNEFRINFKVPFQRFDVVLLDIEKNGGVLISKSVSSDDVTEEFIDNESQVKAQKELELRYLQLVKQAKTIKDMLEIEAKLSEVRGNIERIEGRQRFLQNNTQFSQFEITILDKESKLSNNYFTKLKNSFTEGWDNVFSIILWLIEILPFILVALGVYFLIKKKKISLNIFNKKKE